MIKTKKKFDHHEYSCWPPSPWDCHLLLGAGSWICKKVPGYWKKKMSNQLIKCTWSSWAMQSRGLLCHSWLLLLMILVVIVLRDSPPLPPQYFQLLVELSAQAGAMNLLKIKCKIIITIAMTHCYDHYNRWSRTAADNNSHSNNYPSFSTKDIVSEFSRRLRAFPPLFNLLLLLHHHSWISEAGLIKILLAILQALTQQEVGWC